jgi:hypothetical protein
MAEKIDWEKVLEKEWLWNIWETTVKKQLSCTKNSLLNIIENLSLQKSIEIIEKEKNIKIILWDDNWWYIEFYSSSNFLLWKIWHDWYKLKSNNIDYNHLWIEINWDFQWNWYSKLLYDLYYKYSLENENVVYPDYELAQSNSRINLLLSIWYKIKEIYIEWFFLDVSSNDENKLLKDIKNNYYWKQWYTYKLVLEKDNFD